MKRKFLGILLLILGFIYISPVFAATKGSKATTNGDINKVTLGTETDSKYAFSLKVNNKTSIKVWGYDGKVYKTKDLVIMLPKDSSDSGNMGVWIYNVGSYDGKQVDVKTTYYWNDVKINGTKIYPLLYVWLDREHKRIDNMFNTTSYEVKYELYSGGKPISVNMSLTLEDIDYDQYYGVKTNTGSINDIQVLNDSPLYYLNNAGYRWFYYPETELQSPSDPLYYARFELNNTNSFNIIYGYDRDIYSYQDIFYAPANDNMSSSTITERILYNNDDNQAQFESSASEMTPNKPGEAYFSSYAFGPYTVDAPIKEVSDTDEENKTSNTLLPYSDTLKYNIYSFVPHETSTYYYTSYEITDDVPSELNISSIKVYDDGSNDVTNLFTITNTNNKVSVKAKNPSADSFYNNTYNVEITAKLKDSTLNEIIESKGKVINNKAKVVIKRNDTTTTKETNTVKTTVHLYKITTEVINGEIDEDIYNIDEGSTKEINYRPLDGYSLKEIYVDGTLIDLDGVEDKYIFENINDNHHIKVVYEKDVKYYKVLTEVINGTIDPSVEKIAEGTDVHIKYQPKKGYKLSKIYIDDKEINIEDSIKDEYVFKNISSDHKIKVVYDIENPKTGAFISISLISALALGFVIIKFVQKKQTKLFKI